VTARLGRYRRLQESTSVASGCLRPDSFACVVFTRTLWFSLADAPCRVRFLCAEPLRARHSVYSRQIPSRCDAPRHSPPEPEHLPPRSLTPPSRREPPHPDWFCHQPRCFRHICHALRCALGPRSRGFKAPSTTSMCRSSVSINSTFHEHTTNIKELRPRRLASCLRRMTVCLSTSRCVSAASCQGFDQPAHPLRGVIAVLRTAVAVLRIGFPRVRCTVALTPTSTTAHRGGFTPAGGGPDTSCHQQMLGSVWKSGPNVGAVARLPVGNQLVNMLDRGRARLRVARRASSRNENRGAEPEVPSIASSLRGVRCGPHRSMSTFFSDRARHPLTRVTIAAGSTPSHRCSL